MTHVDSLRCRLCTSSCQDGHLSEENSEMAEVYRITKKYFPAKFLEPLSNKLPPVLCLDCWGHIIDFYSFQDSIFQTQKHLMGTEFNDVKDFVCCMSNTDNISNLLNGRPANELKIKQETTDTKDKCLKDDKESLKRSHAEMCDNYVDHIDISLSDLDDIDIQFSSDDEELTTAIKDEKELPLKVKTENDQDKKPKEPNPTKTNEHTIKKIDKIIADFKPKLICWVCDVSVDNFEQLVAHFTNNHNIGQCYVSCCQQKFSTNKEFYIHIRGCHSEKPTFICETCTNHFPTFFALQKHKAKRHNFQCTQCANILTTREEFETHYNAHFVGTNSNRSIETPVSLSSNRQKIHSIEATKPKVIPDGGAFMCKDCGKRMSSKTLLESHRRTVHSEDNKFVCYLCHKNFKKFLHLRDHVNSHNTDNYYKCPHCKAYLKYWELLRGHVERDHMEQYTTMNMNKLLEVQENHQLLMIKK